VCVKKATDKSGIAYVMRIEREFDALLSLQLNRTPHHRRPSLISEACFHCHAPPCTPPCLRVPGKNEMKKKLGGPGGFFNYETHGKFLCLFVPFCGHGGNSELGRGRGGFAERGMATKNTKTQATRRRWRFFI
jgi:hypothetical protein